MKDLFGTLDEKDKELLVKAPVIITLLAAATEGELDRTEIRDAIEMAHLRTFTAPESLQSYYREVERIFQNELDKMINDYSPFNKRNRNEIAKKMDEVYAVIKGLDEDYGSRLLQSLNSYAKHVSESHRNFLYNMLLPVDIPEIND